MREIAVNCENQLAPFMEYHCDSHGAFVAGRGVALLDVHEKNKTVDIIAGVWFEGFNGANINMHVAAIPGKRWMTREYLWYVFHYAFEQCGARRITGLVEETNYAARKFDEHIGFKLETKLKDACPQGDLLVYVMRKEDCRWLNIRRRGLPEMILEH